MNNFLDIVSKNEMIIVYSLIIIMGILMVIVIFIDKKKSNLLKDNNIIKYVDESCEKENAINELKNIEEELKYEKLLKTIDEIPEEKTLDNKEEQIIINEDEKKGQEDIKIVDNQEENITLNNYESDLEENAIISYNELVKLNDKIFDENEQIRLDDEGNEPITIEELKSKFNKTPIIKKEVELMDFNTQKKFVATPFISPIYGMEEVKEEKEIEVINILEQTANIEKYEIEIRKTNEFLKILKELKEKLNF